jgi:hypothetical protein
MTGVSSVNGDGSGDDQKIFFVGDGLGMASNAGVQVSATLSTKGYVFLIVHIDHLKLPLRKLRYLLSNLLHSLFCAFLFHHLVSTTFPLKLLPALSPKL